MKHRATMLLALWLGFCVFSIALFAQSNNDLDPRWSRVVIDMTTMSSGDPNFKWDEPPQVTRQYFFGDGSVIVNPNFRPHPTTNSTQSEMSVDMHPLDENVIFGSANATPWPVTTVWGTGVYWSLDGAQTWAGADIPPWGQNGGDPASVVGANGYFYEGYLVGGSYSLGLAVSTNSGTSWTPHIAYGVSSQDKEHVMVDKTASSPYFHRIYYPWSNLNIGEASLVYSTDFGTTWSALKDISSTITPLGSAFAQGPNVQVASNGDVYVCYAIYDANWTDGEDAIGFAKSTDGGATWPTQIRAYQNVNFGIRGTLSSKGGIRVNSFPSMAVDNSGGANDGNIYITWSQRGGHPPAGSDPDIAMIMSSDGGATWTAPVRVNDDPLSNGKDQYFSWANVDQSNGRLSIIFYDSRDVPNNQAEVFVAYSDNGGSTFNNVKVSDHVFNPVPIPGLAGGYQGDYIGIASLNDIAYGYWADNSSGIYQGWMVKLEFSAPCPVEVPTNPAPANGATDVPISQTQISWTNGAGANTNETYFGTDPGSLPLVQSGTLATSWNIPGGTLQYSTTYYWRVIELGDTCNQTGPIWSFTTESDPMIQIVQIYCDDFESGSGDWTITNDGGTCIWETRVLSSRPYTMPPTASGNGFTADVDLCGSGTTLLSTATLNTGLDLSMYNGFPVTAAWVDFDNDWRILSAQDEAHVQVSTDGGTTWTGVWDQVGVDVRASHESVDLTSYVGQADVRFRLKSVQPGWDWWWAVDNFCVTIESITPVELTSFTATYANENVQLNWSTATETNNQGFEIERRTSNSDFEKIGYIAGFGTTTETHNYSFSDSKVNTGSYTYRLKQIDFDGTFEYSNEVEVDVVTPLEFALDQNYPNPFNPSTTIKYSLAADGQVKLAVYNLLGEEVASLVNSVQKAGRYEVNFNASNLASGVYIYRLETPNFTSAKKLMLMK